MVFRNRSLSGKRGGKAVVAARFTQKRKHVDYAFTHHLGAAEARDTLHPSIPRDDLAVAIKREDAIDAGVDQPGKQQCSVLASIISIVFQTIFDASQLDQP